MAQFQGTVTDYDTASAFLGERQSKKLANNTYVHMWGETINVSLHTHVIAEYFRNGNIVLTHAGYPTHTTRQRLSKLNSHWNFVQRDGKQYLQSKTTGELVPFSGVVELLYNGEILRKYALKG